MEFPGRIRSVIVVGFAALLLATLGVGVSQPSDALAAPPVPKAKAETVIYKGGHDKGGHAHMGKLLVREQDVLKLEAASLAKANAVVGTTQGYIKDQSDRDTSKLQAALDVFKLDIAAAQGKYDAAKSRLDSHSGFDADGNVTDAALARETLRLVGQDERRCHQLIKQGSVRLRAALKEYRAENKLDTNTTVETAPGKAKP
jgi:hypothetical protein